MTRVETLGQRIARLRLAAGYATMSELAAEIWGTRKDKRGYEVPRNRDSVWRWETDQSHPNLVNLRRLATALGVSTEDVWGGPVHWKRITRKPLPDEPEGYHFILHGDGTCTVRINQKLDEATGLKIHGILRGLENS